MDHKLKQAASEYAEAVKLARGMVVQDKLGVNLTIFQTEHIRMEPTHAGRSTVDVHEYDVLGTMTMRSGIGRAFPTLQFDASVAVEYDHDQMSFKSVDNIEVVNKNKLGGFGDYIEALLVDSWHEWVDNMPHPPRT